MGVDIAMKRWAFPLGVVTGAMAIVLVGMTWAGVFGAEPSSDAGAPNSARPTLAEVGAQFPEFSGLSVRDDNTFEPSVPRSEAEAIAVAYVMDGFGVPRGAGLEGLFEVRSTTGLYTGGSKPNRQPKDLARKETWPIQNRQVWAVVVYDLPVAIPFGKPGMTYSESEIPRARMNVAVDANTGEILGTALTGAGGPSPKWELVIMGANQDRPIIPLTPTPTPEPQ
jgi:hypothetical protein